jgi:hypothetical protein
MARIAGADRPPSLFARVVYWLVKRRLGRVPLPVRIHARHKHLFKGYVEMEVGQDRARTVAARLKALVGVRAAQVIGCPF